MSAFEQQHPVVPLYSCQNEAVLAAGCSRCSAFSISTLAANAVLVHPWLQVVGVTVQSVVLQALDGTQTELQLQPEEKRNPVLLNSTFCTNAVLKVSQAGRHQANGSCLFCRGPVCHCSWLDLSSLHCWSKTLQVKTEILVSNLNTIKLIWFPSPVIGS